MRHVVLALTAALALAACGAPTADLDQPVEPLGDFRLGFSEVVAPNLEAYLVTERIAPEVWTAAVDEALERRFGRFGGGRLYHLGVSVEAYSMPPPLVPGRMLLAMRVTVWDDATQTKMNDETELITAIRVLDGSIARATRTQEEKVRLLAEEAANLTERWLREQMTEEGWFAFPDAQDGAAAQGLRAASTAAAVPPPDGAPRRPGEGTTPA